MRCKPFFALDKCFTGVYFCGSIRALLVGISTIFFMQISWLSYNAFRITTNGITVLVDPVDPKSGFKIHKQGADIVVSSHESDELSKIVSGSPFIVSHPGEYEVKSVFVRGIAHGEHTMYVIRIEDIMIASLGAAKFQELTDAELAIFEGSDVVLIPVGGGPVTAARDAVKIINQIEPRIVIPSYYKVSGSKGIDSLDVFLKEYSAPREEVEKYKVSKKDLVTEDTRVVIVKQA